MLLARVTVSFNAHTGTCVGDQDLSVLKSHFNPACSFVLNRCIAAMIVFCERSFVRTFDLQKGFNLSEAVNDAAGPGQWLWEEMVWVPKIRECEPEEFPLQLRV